MKPVSPENPEILLASGSPRRHQLMKGLGFRPVIRVSDIPEAPQPGESPKEYARRLAADKARTVEAMIYEEAGLPDWILSADTVVVLDGELLEKPVDEADARRMLRRLAGQKHQVITAFCWLYRGPVEGDRNKRMKVVDVSAWVWIRELDAETISRYVATGEPMDKAGSYGIQEIGGSLVRRIEGSYFSVVGLPVCEVVETLEQMGGLTSYPF